MKQRYTYVWNGIKGIKGIKGIGGIGGNEAYDQSYSSRKKAVLAGILKGEEYGYM